MKKAYRLTFDPLKDKDVIDILESVPKTLRSRFIVDVVRFAGSHIVEAAYNNNSKGQNNPAPEENKEKEIDFSKIFGGV